MGIDTGFYVGPMIVILSTVKAKHELHNFPKVFEDLHEDAQLMFRIDVEFVTDALVLAGYEIVER